MFKKYNLIELKVNPEDIFKNCGTTVGFFTTERFEHSLNIGGHITCDLISWVKEFKMSGHALVATLRSYGYLIDWSSIDFKNAKCLYRQVEECHSESGTIKPFKPDALEDITELTDLKVDLSGSATSKPSA